MGGGIGMGNTCKPMAVSFQCMTKFTTKKKKKEFSTVCCDPHKDLGIVNEAERAVFSAILLLFL